MQRNSQVGDSNETGSCSFSKYCSPFGSIFCKKLRSYVILLKLIIDASIINNWKTNNNEIIDKKHKTEIQERKQNENVLSTCPKVNPGRDGEIDICTPYRNNEIEQA